VVVVGDSGGCDVIVVVVLLVTTVPWRKWMSENFASLCCIWRCQEVSHPLLENHEDTMDYTGNTNRVSQNLKMIMHSSIFDGLEVYIKYWPWPIYIGNLFGDRPKLSHTLRDMFPAGLLGLLKLFVTGMDVVGDDVKVIPGIADIEGPWRHHLEHHGKPTVYAYIYICLFVYVYISYTLFDFILRPQFLGHKAQANFRM